MLPEETALMADTSHINYLDDMVLKDAMDCLPEDQQAIIALITAGFKQTEICSILQVSRTTIWTKKIEAFDTLRELIRGNIKCQDTTNV
jgi:DNA-directed RNA polymerase specialized sigma24 family protein